MLFECRQARGQIENPGQTRELISPGLTWNLDSRISDDGDDMFITKKHLSRRTLLKSAGVSLALPLVDAMVPAATALSQTAAARKLRAGFFYIPHGAIMGSTSHGPQMDKWTPTGAGADFKLSPIMKSLEPYKNYVISIGNLENK